MQQITGSNTYLTIEFLVNLLRVLISIHAPTHPLTHPHLCGSSHLMRLRECYVLLVIIVGLWPSYRRYRWLL